MLFIYIAKRMNKVYFSRKETLPGYVSRSKTNLLMLVSNQTRALRKIDLLQQDKTRKFLVWRTVLDCMSNLRENNFLTEIN